MRDLTDDVARKRAAACGRYPGEPPDIAVMRLEYFQDNGWELDLDDPVDIASKLHWLKAFYRDERYPVMADKLAARDIVRQATGDAYLSELHWSGARLPAAPPAGLPARFMLKANHGWNMPETRVSRRRRVRVARSRGRTFGLRGRGRRV